MKKTNLLLIIALSFFITNCGLVMNHEELASVDPSVQPFVDRFNAYSAAHGREPISDLVVVLDGTMKPFEDNGTITLGLCYFGTQTTSPKIKINPNFWERASLSAKEELIFHELGHCILGRDHTSTQVVAADAAITIPVSIMHPYHLGRDIFEGNYNQYISELFTRSTKPMFYLAASQYDSSFYGNRVASTMVAKGSVTINEEGEFDLAGMACGDADHDHQAAQ